MDRGSMVRVWLPLLIGLSGLSWIFLEGPGPRDPARVIGLVLGLIGLGGVILARYTLGSSFSVAPKARALVNSGVYSRIRNPIYVFAEIFILGLVVMIRNRYLLIAPVVLIPLQVIRARKEAAVLEAKFGDAYRGYRKSTWF